VLDCPVWNTFGARRKLTSTVPPTRSVYCLVTLVFRSLYKTQLFDEETRERVENPTCVSSAGIIAACKGSGLEIYGAGLVAAGRTLESTGAGAVSAFCGNVAGAVGVGLLSVAVPGGR